MKSVAIIVLLTGAALGVIAVAVFALNDRSVLSPPPEAVAEEFARQVARGRYELVRPMLSRAVRLQHTPERLKAQVEPIRHMIGALNDVTAEPGAMTRSSASARAVLHGDNGSAALAFGFVRENGLWAIDAWSLEGTTALDAK